MREALDELDPFVTAEEYMLCEGCDLFVPAGANGDFDHNCAGASPPFDIATWERQISSGGRA